MLPRLRKTSRAESGRRARERERGKMRQPLPPGKTEKSMRTQRLMWIAWPAFLMAGVLEMLVFAFVDPQDLHWFGQPLAVSREGVYTLAFFAFWAITLVSSALTTLLAMSPFELNRCPVDPLERPDDCRKVSCP